MTEQKEVVTMQVMWMVTETMLLIVGGVIGLALVTHIAAWTRRR